jgi:hypothetical protein
MLQGNSILVSEVFNSINEKGVGIISFRSARLGITKGRSSARLKNPLRSAGLPGSAPGPRMVCRGVDVGMTTDRIGSFTKTLVFGVELFEARLLVSEDRGLEWRI